jgi:hypothetical protein
MLYLRQVERVRALGLSAPTNVRDVQAGRDRKVGGRGRRKSTARSASRARKATTKSRRKRAAR